MKRLFIALLAALLLSACGEGPTVQREFRPAAPAQPTPAQLRVTNVSEFPLEEVVIRFPNEEITFGPVDAGETTMYQPVQRGVYRYAAYIVVFDGREVNQPVTDWLGEEPLDADAFTYILNIEPELPQMIQGEVVIDTSE